MDSLDDQAVSGIELSPGAIEEARVRERQRIIEQYVDDLRERLKHFRTLLN